VKTSNTAPSVSRRTALAGLSAGGLGLVLATRRLGASAEDATPAATPFPMADHPLVGVWQMENQGVWSFGGEGNFGLFEPTGFGRLCVVGEWRPTGERTAELVFVLQGIELKDLFDPGQAAEPYELSPRFTVWRVSAEVDASGNTMTIAGEWNAVMEGTPQPVQAEDKVQDTGIRMAPVSTQAGSTPTS
jgi:hypothetical protein